MTLDELLKYFPDAQRDGDGYKARCPVPTHGGSHKPNPGDHNPSLKISLYKDRPSVKCWVGCTPVDVLKVVGLTPGMVDGRDRKGRASKPKAHEVERYDYVDEHGVLHDQKVRMFPKSFWWCNATTKQPVRSTYRGLYGVKELSEAPLDHVVLLVEGEKSVNLLRKLGALAVCPPDGAGGDDPGLKWRPCYTDAFARRPVIVLPDNDAPGRALMQYAVSQLRRVAASVKLVDGLIGVAEGGDVYDYLTNEKEPRTIEALLRWCEKSEEIELAPPLTVAQAHEIFRRWFGPHYDIAALDAVLATIAAEQLDGDPVWLLIVSGPGATKTELVMAARGAGAIVTSDISSPGALLSGTSQKEKAKGATGGLLQQMGEHGLLGLKDITTILSMNREARAALLAAFREIYDGLYQRNLGSDGGKTLTWMGRLVVIGGVTTKWDACYEVIAAMGDRFLLLRLDSNEGREEACDRSFANVGHELAMRSELADTVGRVIAGMQKIDLEITEEERDRLKSAANLVTLARTAVEFDYQKNVEMAHAPEMPTRFAKQLLQIFRGACAIGITRHESINLAIRCARDSMPPLRLAVLETVQTLQGLDDRHDGVSVTDVANHVDQPWQTVRRGLDALQALGLLTKETEVIEEKAVDDGGVKEKRRYYFALREGVDPRVLDLSPQKSEYAVLKVNKKERAGRAPSDKCGEGSPQGDLLKEAADVPF